MPVSHVQSLDSSYKYLKKFGTVCIECTKGQKRGYYFSLMAKLA